jgi:outer membrane protein OmpA-like peptidoglycan-associated protein
VFVAPDAAADTLRPIAEQIVDGGLTATVTGTTARVGDLQGQRALSLERAQAVADVLADHGVPADAMTVAGLGSEFPGYVEADPAANRKVVLQLGGASAGVTCAQD